MDQNPEKNEQTNDDSSILVPWDLVVKENELEEAAEVQEQANWGNEKCCTYEEGYIAQPVFACRTCSAKSKQQFGFCFGCSLNCHLFHEVIELFHKRGFRCDCGTVKSSFPCELRGMKDSSTPNNDKNTYNHNFDGLYCWCNQEYKEEETMMQCVLCQDWFHFDCVQKKENAELKDNEESDFICVDCKQKSPFFDFYLPLILYPSIQLPEGIQPTGDCRLEFWKKWVAENKPDWKPTNIFLTKKWFLQLCECDKCKSMYEEYGLPPLLNDLKENDEAYEKENDVSNEDEAPVDGTTTSSSNNNAATETVLGKRKSDLYAMAQEAFLKAPEIPSATKVDLIQAQDDFHQQLVEFFKDKGFVGTGKVITKEDIDSFTQELLKRRKS